MHKLIGEATMLPVFIYFAYLGVILYNNMFSSLHTGTTSYMFILVIAEMLFTNADHLLAETFQANIYRAVGACSQSWTFPPFKNSQPLWRFVIPHVQAMQRVGTIPCLSRMVWRFLWRNHLWLRFPDSTDLLIYFSLYFNATCQFVTSIQGMYCHQFQVLWAVIFFLLIVPHNLSFYYQCSSAGDMR